MRFQRFLTGLSLGLILAITLACSQQVLMSGRDSILPSETAAIAPDAVREGAAPTVENPAPALPPETQALVASAGPEGLYAPPRKDIRLVVISDLNSSYGSTDYDPEVDKAMALLPFWRPDLVVCSGDMVAGQDLTLTPDRIRAMWQAFDDHVAAPLRQQKLPYGFTLGNHDASSALGVNNQFLFKQERDLASAYWLTPEHDPGVKFIDRTDFPFYYTFEYNGLFFMAWDGSSSHIPDDKLAWIETTLASEAAQQAKARIVLSHLPLYSVAVGRNEPGEVLDNAQKLQEILERHRVHTLISGHHHSYYPAHRGKLQLLHMGILGSGARPLIDNALPPWKALTVVDIDFNDPALTTYTTYDMQTLRTIEYEQLPRFLAGHNGMLLRRDVRYEDLKPEEKAFCQERLGKSLCTGHLQFPQPQTYAA
ncbi:MAG TPA: metallophosphoesterase [Leptolyngbyaceae cyanobacterium M65_K2018_010]|nr:metallophosphoesterase [Leptolyngbyaceae cyanobacterium M65_K2018_010]